MFFKKNKEVLIVSATCRIEFVSNCNKIINNKKLKSKLINVQTELINNQICFAAFFVIKTRNKYKIPQTEC